MISPEPERFHALDAVRAFALIAGIALHATMSFLPDISTTGWPILDRSPSMALEVTFYAIHVFRMSVFYVIAGFFAHLSFHRKGATGFIRDRSKRILVPMLVGYVILTPLSVAVFFGVFVKTHGGAMPTHLHSSGAKSLPLTHLWFLYYLLWFYALTLAVRAIVLRWLDPHGSLRSAVDHVLRVLVNGYVAPLALAIPIAACLYWLPGWVWIGIPIPEFGLTPQPAAMVGFGSAFLFGWLLQRQTRLLATLARRWAMHMILAVVATTASWKIVSAPLSFVALVPPNVKFLYAVTYSLAIWTGVFGLIGFAVRFCSSTNAVTRYVADASYWMYLIHAPLVLALATLVIYWPVGWVVKYPLILIVTFSISLVSYRFLVRFTFVGAVLNGRRYRSQDIRSIARTATA